MSRERDPVMFRTRAVTLCVVSCAIVGLEGPASAEFLLVAPESLDQVEGNWRLLNLPPPPNGFQAQWVYPASDFLRVPEHMDTITSVSWRPDQSMTGPITTVFSNFELRLSTTNATPGGLNSTLGDNTGPDEVLVYSGPITLKTDATPQSGPLPFDYLIEFQTPFVYDPAQGNLLLDYTFGPDIDGRPNVDAQGSQPPPAMISGQGPGAAYIATQFGFHAADYDHDGQLSASDIDLLSAALVPGGASEIIFDLDGNGAVEQEDRRIWVEDVVGTNFGDANLDGSVSFVDFLALSDHFDSPGGWGQGDFDGDGMVQFSDFLVLSTNFGTTSTTVAVPEPCPAISLTIGLLLVTFLGSARSSRRVPIFARHF